MQTTKKKIKLDENYNPIPNKEDIYKDSLIENVSEVVELRSKGLLSEGTANVLVRFIIQKELNRDTKLLTNWVQNLQPFLKS